MPTADHPMAIDFSLPTPFGTVVSLSGLRHRKAGGVSMVRLLFVGRWEPSAVEWLSGFEQSGPAELVVIDSESSLSDLSELTASKFPEGPTLLLDTAQEVARAYGIIDVPTLLELDSEGRVSVPSQPRFAVEHRPLAWKTSPPKS